MKVRLLKQLHQQLIFPLIGNHLIAFIEMNLVKIQN